MFFFFIPPLLNILYFTICYIIKEQRSIVLLIPSPPSCPNSFFMAEGEEQTLLFRSFLFKSSRWKLVYMVFCSFTSFSICLQVSCRSLAGLLQVLQVSCLLSVSFGVALFVLALTFIGALPFLWHNLCHKSFFFDHGSLIMDSCCH